MSLPLQIHDPSAEERPYDIVADQKLQRQRLAHSQEIEGLTATIDVSDFTTIVTFGARAAEDIAQASDDILHTLHPQQEATSNDLMMTLTGIMSRFEPDDFQEKSSLFSRLLGNVQHQIDQNIAKYHSMGSEIDRIYVRLRQYEQDIQALNTRLDDLLTANIAYFHTLEKYVVAGEQGCEEIADYKTTLEEAQRQSFDPSVAMELETITQALTLLQHRTHALKTAELIALQTIPMIQMLRCNNLQILQKINSAFLVTLPIFQKALAQAIQLKKQHLQAEALSALNRRTQLELRKHAKNADAAKLQMPYSNAQQFLTSSRQTILSGIAEVQQMQHQADAQHNAERTKLEALRSSFNTSDTPDALS